MEICCKEGAWDVHLAYVWQSKAVLTASAEIPAGAQVYVS